VPIHFLSGVVKPAPTGCPVCVRPATMATDMAAMLDEVRCLSRIEHCRAVRFHRGSRCMPCMVSQHSMTLF
jgi:hypothetical protein